MKRMSVSAYKYPERMIAISISYSIHQMIRNELDKKRRKAMDELERRKAELYSRFPRLDEIENEINTAGLRYNKAILMGKVPADSAAEELTQKIEELVEERRQILTANGYPADYLVPVFECSKCSDTGIISSPDGKGDILCVCYRQLLLDYLYDNSNLSISRNDGFASFNTDLYPDTVDEERYGIKKSPRRQIIGILENCRQFTERFGDPETRNLLFCGPTGTGKTFMAGCIAMELMRAGHTVLYFTAPALFNTIYEYRYNSGNNEEWDPGTYKNILEADLLIIDDLGTESPSAMRYAELLNILDTRTSNDIRKPCKTIIATNIDLRNLFEYYDERIVSRITGSFDIYRFAGDDIRNLRRQS
ncbi:MAG TPA: ATP-binding protein [Clostridiales bacterium]|nr:ATP-binding protein [Clostridiales bacterium]